MDALVGLVLMAAAVTVVGVQLRSGLRGHLAPAATPAADGGGLFAYLRLTPPGARCRPDSSGCPQGGHRPARRFAVLAIATSGFRPTHDAITELALVEVGPQSGVPTTLTAWQLHPGQAGDQDERRTDGPIAGHAQFEEVAAAVMARLRGSVVVVHDAEFVERFLQNGLLRAGLVVPVLPALDLSVLARQLLPVPNTRPAALARHLGLGPVDTRSATGQVRVLEATLATILERAGDRLGCPTLGVAVHAPGRVVPATPGRALPAESPPAASPPSVPPEVGPSRWLVDLLTGLPMGARELHDARLARFIDAVITALCTHPGTQAGDEVRRLSRLLAAAGESGPGLRSILAQILESVRRALFAPPPAGPARLCELRMTAAALGRPDYFDDLIPTPEPVGPSPGSGSFAVPVRKPPPPPPPARLPRCGRCLGFGHYSPDCPQPPI